MNVVALTEEASMGSLKVAVTLLFTGMERLPQIGTEAVTVTADTVQLVQWEHPLMERKSGTNANNHNVAGTILSLRIGAFLQDKRSIPETMPKVLRPSVQC